MTEQRLPGWYKSVQKEYKQLTDALEALGKVVRRYGPLDEKTSQLIQLAAAATLRSEGAVHSHVRRAIGAGATPEEVRHALVLLTSTIGFPNVSAALSWADHEMTRARGSQRGA